MWTTETMRPHQRKRWLGPTRLARNFPPMRGNVSGLTLLELLLVLVILTAVATIAIESMEPSVDQARFEATQEMVENVERAILDEKRTANGRIIPSGFVADLGRPPLATLEQDESGEVLTLRELWDGTGLPTYGGVRAEAGVLTTSNPSANTDADGDEVFADGQVILTFGWRGPYVQLPSGAVDLRDGWGHRLVSSSIASHLRGHENTDITVSGSRVFGVRSFGKDDVRDLIPETDYNRDVPSSFIVGGLNEDNTQGTVRGTVFVNGAIANPNDIYVQIFYPAFDGFTKMVAVQSASLKASVPGACSDAEVPLTEIEIDGNANLGFNASKFAYRFDDGCGKDVPFPVGSPVVRAYYQPSGGTVTKSLPITFALIAGNNYEINLTINVSPSTP